MSSDGRKGLIFVLSGPSGSGKTTVLNNTLGKFPGLRYSVSATTRKKRSDEREGRNYFFISRDEFERMIAEGAFLEYTNVFGNYYGTLRSQVDDAVSAGDSVILEIEPEGAGNVHRLYPDAVLVFLTAPSLEVQRERLSKRGSETEESLRIRLEGALRELENAGAYDYVIINKDSADSALDLAAIIRAETISSENRLPLGDELRDVARAQRLKTENSAGELARIKGEVQR